MPHIDLDQLKDWLQLPDTDLRDKLQELIPYVPENIYLAPVTHLEYGAGHVISAKPDDDGFVWVTFLKEITETGAAQSFLPIAELTFTKPADPKPRQLVTLEEIAAAPPGTAVRSVDDRVLGKGARYWYETGISAQLTSDDMLDYAPLTVLEPTAEPVSASAKPAHPEWLVTLEDYEDAPIGTICAADNNYPISKSVTGEWKVNGVSGSAGLNEAAGTRRRVLRWKWDNGD